MVKVVSTAKGEIKHISINDSLMKQEEKEITEDLIVAAINDAKQKGETAAQEEQAQLEAAVRAKQEEEERQRAFEEERKRREAEEKLRSEQSRQEQIKQRRTAQMEALRVEELKERGEWVDPAIEEAKRQEELARQAEESEKAQMQQQMAQMQQQMTQMKQQTEAQPVQPVEQPKKSKAPMIALAAVLVAVIGAGAVLGLLMTQQYQPDATNYPKVSLEAKEAKNVVTTAAFTPLPKEEEEKVEVAEAKPAAKKSRRGSRRKSSSKSKKKKLKLDLGDDDLFGGGGF